jgi:hypothetical protein
LLAKKQTDKIKIKTAARVILTNVLGAAQRGSKGPQIKWFRRKVRRSSNSSNEGPQEQQGCAAKGSKFNLAHGCEAKARQSASGAQQGPKEAVRQPN